MLSGCLRIGLTGDSFRVGRLVGQGFTAVKKFVWVCARTSINTGISIPKFRHQSAIYMRHRSLRRYWYTRWARFSFIFWGSGTTGILQLVFRRPDSIPVSLAVDWLVGPNPCGLFMSGRVLGPGRVLNPARASC